MSWETLAAGQQLAAQIGPEGVRRSFAGRESARSPRNWRTRSSIMSMPSSMRCSPLTPPTRYTAALEQLIRKAQPVHRAVPAYLSGSRLRAQTRHALQPGAGQRRDRLSRRIRRACFRSPAFSRQAQRRCEAGRRRAALRFHSGRSISRGSSSKPAPRRWKLSPRADARDQFARNRWIRSANRRAPSISPSADIIVSVGRGIKEKDNIPIVEELAKALGGELAASRPICD